MKLFFLGILIGIIISLIAGIIIYYYFKQRENSTVYIVVESGKDGKYCLKMYSEDKKKFTCTICTCTEVDKALKQYNHNTAVEVNGKITTVFDFQNILLSIEKEKKLKNKTTSSKNTEETTSKKENKTSTSSTTQKNNN